MRQPERLDEQTLPIAQKQIIISFWPR